MPAHDAIARFEQLLAQGRDSALLRYGLGNEHLKRGDPLAALDHLQRAVELDPSYSAAWKLLGRALADGNRKSDALSAYRQGICIAEEKGDKQAANEMRVFLRRLEKELGAGE
jgi:predicted Zn-dependent protease